LEQERALINFAKKRGLPLPVQGSGTFTWQARFWEMARKCNDPRIEAAYQNGRKYTLLPEGDWKELFKALRNAELRVSRLKNTLAEFLSADEINNILRGVFLPTDQEVLLKQVIETRKIPTKGWMALFWEEALKTNDPRVVEAHNLFVKKESSTVWKPLLSNKLQIEFDELQSAASKVSKLKNDLSKFFIKENLDEYVKFIISPFEQEERLLELADDFGINLGQSPGWERRFWLRIGEMQSPQAQAAFGAHFSRPQSEWIRLLEELEWEDGVSAAREFLDSKNAEKNVVALKKQLREALVEYKIRHSGAVFRVDSVMENITRFFQAEVSSPFARENYLKEWISGTLTDNFNIPQVSLRNDFGNIVKQVPPAIDKKLVAVRTKMVRLQIYWEEIAKTFKIFDLEDSCIRLGMLSDKQVAIVKKTQGLFADNMLVLENEMEGILTEFRQLNLASEEELFAYVKKTTPIADDQIRFLVEGGENSVVGRAIKDTLEESDEILKIIKQGRSIINGPTYISVKLCRFSKLTALVRSKPILTIVPVCLAFLCLDQVTNAFAKCPNPPSQERLEEAKAKGKKVEQHLQIIQAMRDENRDTQVIAEEIKRYNEEYKDFMQSLSNIKDKCYPTNK
ncbi:MAG: hypothetical protein ABH822_00480, partial [Patescibacteria group bacterium]